jgi:hypothetical protein
MIGLPLHALVPSIPESLFHPDEIGGVFSGFRSIRISKRAPPDAGRSELAE